MQQGRVRKGLVIVNVILFFGTCIVPSIGGSSKITRNILDTDSIENTGEQESHIESTYYGFIIPLTAGNDSTTETYDNTRVRHIINDLLRANITVYWSSTNFTILSKPVDSSITIRNVFYDKGAFIIPFSGDLYLDTFTTAIIYDYNQINEIDKNASSISIYHLLAIPNIFAYPLVEPKIVQYLGRTVCYGWPCYLLVAEAGGYLSYEFLLDDEIAPNLNNNEFNIFMWPLKPEITTDYEQIIYSLSAEDHTAIRHFVNNGGGYIGSCYGACKGSSGMLWPFPLFTLPLGYYPPLSSMITPISLSLSDSLVGVKMFGNNPLHISTNEIVDTNHPITYSINTTIEGLFNGPWFHWVGKNTHTIAILKDLSPLNNGSNNYARLKPLYYSKPIWVNATFGQGKIVLFGDHPEVIANLSIFPEMELKPDNLYGRQVMHNALFFVSAKDLKLTNTNINYPQSFIDSIAQKTHNLSLGNSSLHEFDAITEYVTELHNNISALKNNLDYFMTLFSKKYNNISKHYFDAWTPLWWSYSTCNQYISYCNKSLSALKILERVYPLSLDLDDFVLHHIGQIKINLLWRLNESEKIVPRLFELAEDLEDNLLETRFSAFHMLQIYQDGKDFLRTAKTLLKYIPQIYFETTKLIRYCWYHYETNISLS